MSSRAFHWDFSFCFVFCLESLILPDYRKACSSVPVRRIKQQWRVQQRVQKQLIRRKRRPTTGSTAYHHHRHHHYHCLTHHCPTHHCTADNSTNHYHTRHHSRHDDDDYGPRSNPYNKVRATHWSSVGLFSRLLDCRPVVRLPFRHLARRKCAIILCRPVFLFFIHRLWSFCGVTSLLQTLRGHFVKHWWWGRCNGLFETRNLNTCNKSCCWCTLF